MAEEESDAVRCLAQMSDESTLNLEQENSSLSEEKEGTNTAQNDHDYVEGPGVNCAQPTSKIDIINRVSPNATTFATPVSLVQAPLTPLQDHPQQNDATDAVVTTETQFEQPWTKIGTWTSPYKGYFGSNKELEQAIKAYTEESDSRWVVSAKDKLFNSEDIKISNFKLFWRGREDNRKAAFPDFDGIPFIMVGRKTWGCHLGRDKCRSGKIKYRTKMQEESQEGTEDKWPLIRSSKKLGCPAMISGVHVLKFHEYPIAASTSEFHRKQTLKKLRLSLLSKHCIVKAEQRFYINLAELDEHIHDMNTLQDSTSPEVKVDRRLMYKITELHHAGMFRLAEVSRVLEYYRKQLYKDDEPPSKELIPELYPSLNCIHYFISHAVKVTSLLEMDLGRGHRLVSSWQTKYPNDSWYYQPFASSGPIKRAKNKLDHRLVGHYPDLTQTFLFCCQNAAQRQLLSTYGTMCVLDSPQGKTVLPTYFLLVRTNSGYQVVCTIIMQNWSSQALMDALQVVKDWNPEWQPQAILVDLVEDEIEAMEKLFPESNIFISFVHRERMWQDYLSSTNEEDQIADSLLLDSLVYARTEEELNDELKKLQESPLWKQNHRLRHWMTVRWLPCIKKWSFAYFSKHLLVTLCANEGLDRLREALVYDWLEGVRSRTLSELLSCVIMYKLPMLYDSYCEENQKMAESTRYQYLPMLPVYIRHQPVAARSSINEAISKAPLMDVTKIEEGKFLVRLVDAEFDEHRVSFGDEYEYPSCDCWTWVTRMEICEHFAAVFKEYKDWHWCQLSPLYTGNPIFKLDQVQLDSPPRDMPHCGDVSEIAVRKEYIQVSMDDFGAEEVLMDNDSDDDGNGGRVAGSTWHIDQKQTTCKSLLDQLGQLTEQMKDPEDMDYMSNNLVVLLKQMQGKRDEPPSPKKQRGRKKLKSESTR